MNDRSSLLTIKDLTVEFTTDEGVLKAVDGVSFSIKKGETLGLVGESGSGKSVTALSIMRLISGPIGRITKGAVFFDNKNLLDMPERELRKLRGNRISMIFQEPMTSLNPVFTIGDQIMEVLRLHQGLSKRDARKKCIELLSLVGISAPSDRVDNYPHQMSGGMRQRVMIAMALSCKPDLLIADEPTTALDVTIQAQIMELMKNLQTELKMGIVLITHDLGIVAETCDRVLVMYAGQIVEDASVDAIFSSPRHPYTLGLLNSVPAYQGEKALIGLDGKPRLRTIPGMVPNLLELKPGCRFYDRCFKRQNRCAAQEIQQTTEIGRKYRCLIPNFGDRDRSIKDNGRGVTHD